MELASTFSQMAEFWTKEFPNEKHIALACISAPPTQCSVERLFSFNGFVVNHLRTLLKGEKLNKICFIKKNAELAFD